MRTRGMTAALPAGDAVPRLSGLARGAGSRRRGCGLAARLWPGWRSRRVLAPHAPGRAPLAPERITLALSETLTAALTQQARTAGSDPQHLSSRPPGRFCSAV